MKLRMIVKTALLIGTLIAVFVGYQRAEATSVLKSVQVLPDSLVNLEFDSKLTKNQIKTEFFRDIIQVSIKDGSVYPAKITPVNNSEITKVFAYQYTPNLIRARFSVSGEAESYQDRVSVDVVGNRIQLKIKPKAGATPVGAPANVSVSKADLSKEVARTEGEKSLLNQIILGAPKTPEAPVTKKDLKKDSLSLTQSAATTSLTGPKSSALSQFARLFVWGSLLVGFMVGAFLFFKKTKNKKGLPPRGMIGKFIQKFSGQKKSKGPSIEVIANHYLGPKKSIAVVKIKDKTLILGITDESINLITQMNELDPLSDGFDDEAAKFIAESDLSSKPMSGASAKNPQAAKSPSLEDSFSSMLDIESTAADHFGVRQRIKKKVEAMKQI